MEKLKMIFDEYLRLCGYKQGGTGSNQYVQTGQNGPFAKLSLDEIASQLDRGITRSLKSYRFNERTIR